MRLFVPPGQYEKTDLFVMILASRDFHRFSPNKALAAEGFLLVFYRIAFVDQDFARGSSVAAANSL